MSLSTLLAAAAHAVTEDRVSEQRATMEAAGLSPVAYWAGTSVLSVTSSLASAAFLVLTAVLLGLFDPASFFALLFLAWAFALSLVALGFFIAAAGVHWSIIHPSNWSIRPFMRTLI